DRCGTNTRGNELQSPGHNADDAEQHQQGKLDGLTAHSSCQTFQAEFLQPLVTNTDRRVCGGAYLTVVIQVEHNLAIVAHPRRPVELVRVKGHAAPVTVNAVIPTRRPADD